jgi:hypothetical protein
MGETNLGLNHEQGLDKSHYPLYGDYKVSIFLFFKQQNLPLKPKKTLCYVLVNKLCVFLFVLGDTTFTTKALFSL